MFLHYALYGQILKTSTDLGNFIDPISDSSARPSLHYSEIHKTAAPSVNNKYAEIFSSKRTLLDGTPIFRSWKRNKQYHIHLASIASYDIEPSRITCYPEPNCDNDTLFTSLVGPVMAFWHETQNISVLHASAVSDRNGCIVFAATSGGGKSTLAAAFLKHTKYNLVTDDQLPIVADGGLFYAHSGHGAIRLTEEQIENFIGVGATPSHISKTSNKILVPVKQFSKILEVKSQPVRRIYILDRILTKGSQIVISTPGKSEALLLLLGNQHTLSLLDSRTQIPNRLEFLASLTHSVPIRNIQFPTGYSRLAEIIETILSDLDD